MLINAQTKEELRVAIMDGTTLEDFQVEVAERGSTRGNIYRGVIAKIEPSLNAAFIDYGAERHGFLPIQDVVEQAWYRKPKGNGGRPRIEDVLERGKPIVVQVSKDAEAQKGAALTTNLSLAGRYLVLTPFDSTRGVSRKVEDDDTRRLLKEQAKKLDVPDSCGVIVRTNALEQNKTALNRDLASLARLWKRVSSEARTGKKVQLIYSDQDLILQALRDYLDPAITEILVDDDDAYARAEEYLKAYLPRGGDRLMRYDEREPLFSRYGAESQIDLIYERRVQLPAGGSIVIDRTEALTAIDVNSGRSTGASSQEQTALATNLEAAREVARQLRLRDIGGLLVDDFIDMRASRNQRKVEKALKDALKVDKARTTVGRISANGLLEINRQRLHQALALRTHRACPTCDGTGRVSSPEMLGRSLLRRIRSRAVTAPLARVRIALHPELAEAIQNSRRHDIAQVERDFDLKVEIVASPRMNLREQEIEWEKREGEVRPMPSPIVTPAAKVRAADAARVDEDLDDDIGDDGQEGEDGEDGQGRTRRRRRRGGSRRRRGDTRASEATGGEATAADPQGAESKGDAETAGVPGGDGQRGARKARRRAEDKGDGGGEPSGRRRAGRRRAERHDASPADETEPSRRDAGEPRDSTRDAGDQEGPRRRRRRARSAEVPSGGDAGGGEATGDASGDGRSSAAGDDGEAGRTRRRRRVGGRDGRPAAAEPSGADEAERTRRARRRVRDDDEGGASPPPAAGGPEGESESGRRRVRRRVGSRAGSAGSGGAETTGSPPAAESGAEGEREGGRRRVRRRVGSRAAGGGDEGGASPVAEGEGGGDERPLRRRRRRGRRPGDTAGNDA